jgi:hypothetical protein
MRSAGEIALPRNATLRRLTVAVNARKPRDEQPPQHLASPHCTMRPEAGVGERGLPCCGLSHSSCKVPVETMDSARCGPWRACDLIEELGRREDLHIRSAPRSLSSQSRLNIDLGHLEVLCLGRDGLPAVLDSFSHFPHINGRFIYRVYSAGTATAAEPISSRNCEHFPRGALSSIASTGIRCCGGSARARTD